MIRFSDQALKKYFFVDLGNIKKSRKKSLCPHLRISLCFIFSDLYFLLIIIMRSLINEKRQRCTGKSKNLLHSTGHEYDTSEQNLVHQLKWILPSIQRISDMGCQELVHRLEWAEYHQIYLCMSDFFILSKPLVDSLLDSSLKSLLKSFEECGSS